jgi:agmatinase
MSAPITFAAPHAFLGARPHDRSAAFCVAGVPLDIGTTNRAGARDGPRAIRAAARMLTDGRHPISGAKPAALDLSDLGEFDIALGDMEKSLALIEEQATGLAHLVAFGGEHSITLALLRALKKRIGVPLGLLHIDAHMDTGEDNFGQSFAHGTVFWHALHEGLVEPRRMVQVGIRAPAWPENYAWTREQGATILSAQDVHQTPIATVISQIRDVLGSGPCYLSFDIDGLDPAFAPGTGTPEIGGLLSWQAQAILRGMAGVDFRGADFVEVAPAYDVSEITALAAATMAWEYLCLFAKKRHLDCDVAQLLGQNATE